MTQETKGILWEEVPLESTGKIKFKCLLCDATFQVKNSVYNHFNLNYCPIYKGLPKIKKNRTRKDVHYMMKESIQATLERLSDSSLPKCPNQKNSIYSPSEDERELVQMMAIHSLSFRTVQSKDFQKFSGKISPTREKIRKVAQIREQTLKAVRGKYFSLVIDDGTIGPCHWFVIGIYTQRSLYLYDCYHNILGSTRSLASLLSSIINKLQKTA
jgi:hypothetical protein